MYRNSIQNIILGIAGIFVFILLFRLSFALLGVLILFGGVYLLVTGIMKIFKTAAKNIEDSKYDEKGRRIAKTSILEMNDAEDK